MQPMQLHQASKDPPLFSVQPLCLPNGPSLPLGQQLPRPRKPQVLPALHLLPYDRCRLQPRDTSEHLECLHLQKEQFNDELHLHSGLSTRRGHDWLQRVELVSRDDRLFHH